MSRPSARFRLPVAASALAAVVVVAAVAVAVRHASTSKKSAPGAGDDEGTVTLSVALAKGSTATSVGYVVKSSNGTPITEGIIEVTGLDVPLSAEVALPPGKGDTVTFLSNTAAQGRLSTWALGTRTFDVDAGRTTPVDLGTVSVGAPPIPRAGVVGSALTAGGGSNPAGAAGAAGEDDSAGSCQSCQLAVDEGRCNPRSLSAVSSSPPSWGCGTLSTPRERVACSTLLHCLNQTDCAVGTNPFLGCFCGSAEMRSCLNGEGITGACFAQYEAAAAITGGPPAGAPPAELVRFLATVGTNPKSPVGLADNIKECALQAHCDACNSL